MTGETILDSMSSLEDYQGKPISEIIKRSTPEEMDSDVFLFIMGPYRLLDPSYLYPDRTEFDLPPDPLAPATKGVDSDEIEATLRNVCQRISEATGVTAFIASDVEIPTKREVERKKLDEPGMTVIEQSLAFASASEGNAFIFTKTGLTTGVGCESGAIPEHFALRSENDRTRSPETFCIFEDADYDPNTDTYQPKFGSASIDEMDKTYDLRFRYFADRRDLVDSLVSFVESYVVPSVS